MRRWLPFGLLVAFVALVLWWGVAPVFADDPTPTPTETSTPTPTETSTPTPTETSIVTVVTVEVTDVGMATEVPTVVTMVPYRWGYGPQVIPTDPPGDTPIVPPFQTPTPSTFCNPEDGCHIICGPQYCASGTVFPTLGNGGFTPGPTVSATLVPTEPLPPGYLGDLEVRFFGFNPTPMPPDWDSYNNWITPTLYTGPHLLAESYRIITTTFFCSGPGTSGEQIMVGTSYWGITGTVLSGYEVISPVVSIERTVQGCTIFSGTSGRCTRYRPRGGNAFWDILDYFTPGEYYGLGFPALSVGVAPDFTGPAWRAEDSLVTDCIGSGWNQAQWYVWEEVYLWDWCLWSEVENRCVNTPVVWPTPVTPTPTPGPTPTGVPMPVPTWGVPDGCDPEDLEPYVTPGSCCICTYDPIIVDPVYSETHCIGIGPISSEWLDEFLNSLALLFGFTPSLSDTFYIRGVQICFVPTLIRFMSHPLFPYAQWFVVVIFFALVAGVVKWVFRR